MKTPKPKLGRPLADETRACGHIHLRVTMDRKNLCVHAARSLGLGLSEWLTDVIDRALAAIPSAPRSSQTPPARTVRLSERKVDAVITKIVNPK